MISFNSSLTPIDALKLALTLPDSAWWLPAATVPSCDVCDAMVLGVSLVLWRADEQWHAAANQCPHRGARLSDGCVKHSHLQCPYHGWGFDTQGTCQLIPAAPDFKPPATHRIAVIQVIAYAGLLWVQLKPDADSPLPQNIYPEHTAAAHTAGVLDVLVGPYDVNTSAARAVENFLDVSHFGTVHAGWLGDAGHMAVPAYTVINDQVSATATGVRAWQPQSQATVSEGAWVDYTYRIAHPSCAQLSKLPSIEGGLQESIAMWAVPLGHESCRLWFSLCMADVGQGAAKVSAFQHTIFLQDKPILEGQHPRALPLDAQAEKHSAADRLSSAYRGLLKRWQITMGTC